MIKHPQIFCRIGYFEVRYCGIVQKFLTLKGATNYIEKTFKKD